MPPINIKTSATLSSSHRGFFLSHAYLHIFVNVSSNEKLRIYCDVGFLFLFIKAPSIKLPSSVFATEFEEVVGLLNKAAPVSGILNSLTFLQRELPCRY